MFFGRLFVCVHTTDIDIGRLKSVGIERIIWDIDGTLLSLLAETKKPSDKMISFTDKVREAGIEQRILSNSTDSEKVHVVRIALGILHVIHRHEGMNRWKPWLAWIAISKMWKLSKKEMKNTILIGNNPWNDGLTALLTGMRYCQVFMP